MNQVLTKRLDAVDEELLYWTHRSGLTIYVAPMKRSSVFAVLTVRFGSDYDRYQRFPGDEIRELPDGVAHFLEHKMFASEDGTDVFEKYAEVGAYANAFTGRNRTSFLFSCTDSFETNLRILLSCITHPYFTTDNIEKELGIIGEEIDMHEDNPATLVSRNLMNAAFHNHPIRKSILGTRASIATITPDILYECVRAFYHPRNMVLSVSGDIDTETVDRICDEYFPVESPPFTSIHVLPQEPADVRQRRVEAEGDISQPVVAVCIKTECPDEPEEQRRIAAANEINMELLFGRSGDFFNRLYEAGVISDRFGACFCAGNGCAYTEIYAYCDDPDRFLSELDEELEHRRETYFSKEEFDRAKRTVYANALFPLDSTEDTALAVSDGWTEDINPLDSLEEMMKTVREDALAVFRETILSDPSKRSVSIVYPKPEYGKESMK